MPHNRTSLWCNPVLQRSRVILDRKRWIVFSESKYSCQSLMTSTFGITNETSISSTEIWCKELWLIPSWNKKNIPRRTGETITLCQVWDTNVQLDTTLNRRTPQDWENYWCYHLAYLLSFVASQHYWEKVKGAFCVPTITKIYDISKISRKQEYWLQTSPKLVKVTHSSDAVQQGKLCNSIPL